MKLFNSPEFKGVFTKSWYVAWQPNRKASPGFFMPSVDNRTYSSYLAAWAFGKLLLVLQGGVYLKKSDRPPALAKLATVYNKAVETIVYESEVQEQIANCIKTPYKLEESNFILQEKDFDE